MIPRSEPALPPRKALSVGVPQAWLVEVVGPRDPTPTGRTLALTASGEPPPSPQSLAVHAPDLTDLIGDLAVTRWGLRFGRLVPRARIATVVEDRRWLRPGDAVVVGRTVLRLRALDVPAAAGFTNMPVSVDVLDAIGGRSRRLRLPYHELIVGSRKDIEGSLDDRHVSGRHCAIQRRRSGAVVRDLESRNGTFVFVRPGDFVPFDAMVVIGRSTYRVRRGPAPSLHRRGQ